MNYYGLKDNTMNFIIHAIALYTNDKALDYKAEEVI